MEFKRDNLPDKPGCYLFKDANGDTIYVGKAKSLKKRVRSYWNISKTGDPLYAQKLKNLMNEAQDLDFFAVQNEAEALILENELIKKHQPVFNAMLKDDKSFPWVQITKEEFPRIKIIRRPEMYDSKHDYIGPFVSSFDLKKMLRFIRKVFPYCNCKTEYKRKNRKRPCTYYQIKLCPAPCFGKVSAEEYQKNIARIKQLLLGQIGEIEQHLTNKMKKNSDKLEFEKAAIWRDRLESLKMFKIKQSILLYDFRKVQGLNSKNNEEEEINGNKVLNNKWKTLDVAAGYSSENWAGLIVMHVRKGRLLGKTPYVINIEDKVGSTADYFVDLFQQHYFRTEIIVPDEIVVKDSIPKEIVEALTTYLVQKMQNQNKHKKIDENRPLTIRYPSESDKTAGLMRIAQKNIELLVKQREKYAEYVDFEDPGKLGGGNLNQGLKILKEKLHLDHLPIIIEAFDMSHNQGEDYVGSKVAFLEGKPNKSEYRRYKIRGNIEVSDDVAAMEEVVSRRYEKLVRENQTKPDLIVIDGGFPQLKVTEQILIRLGLKDIAHIGVVKPEGRSELNKSPKIVFFEDGKKKTLIFPLDSPGLHILQYIRNEAHRFAIKYHRILRNKRQVSSELEKIPGIGPARRTKLLRYFGSVKNVKKASLKELIDIVGRKTAIKIKNNFTSNETTKKRNKGQKEDLKKQKKRKRLFIKKKKHTNHSD